MIHDHESFTRPSLFARIKRFFRTVERAQENGAYWPSMVVIWVVAVVSWAAFFWTFLP